ncbi:MAG TPA: serine/threonine-protein kinase, partial [Gemmataceae bacterium]|nr:serine/threonine-protein kinase [Gemmataceae bacterium]
GGPPPDLDSFVAAFPEPQRSELRAELEALGRSVGDRGGATAELVAPGAAPVDHAPAAPPAAVTIDQAPDATTEHTAVPPPPARPDGTMDYAPEAAAATGVARDTAAGGTVDYRKRAEPEPAPEPKPAAKKGPAEPPPTVAGYELLSVLGRGAMGVVYKARQRGLNRLVALKMILSGEHAGAHELARFQAEAEAVAHLRHPNIVQIYEVGEEQGRPFFSLEFVEGSSLDRKVGGTPMPPLEAARMVLKLARAMDYAHKNNIIHRDLKPANVLLTPDGEPKIGDFGLAKRIDEDAGQTRTGTVLGTPSYMAPEQAEGRLKEVGPLSDEYSLGAILYELLTGRPPFKGSTILDTLNQLRTLEPVPPIEFQPGVPRDLETICLKCLQKDPAKRYADCAALAEDLRRFLAGEPIAARPVSRTERLVRWGKRNPRVAALVGAVAALVLLWAASMSVLSVGLKRQKDRADQNAREAREQEGIARQNEEKAKEQETLAKNNETKAKEQEALATQNEKKAKATAERTVAQMIDLGRGLHNRLQGKRLVVEASPVTRALREQLLQQLRQSLVLVSQTIEGYKTTPYGTAAVCQALGDLLMDVGQAQEAKKLYLQGYEAMKKLTEAEPDNDQAQANLGVMLLRLGDAALNADCEPRAARDRYRGAREVRVAILNRPGRQRPELQCKIDIAHDDMHVGFALMALGQPAAAHTSFEEAREYRREWRDSDPKNWEARNYLMQTEEWLGTTCSHLGQEKAMREHFNESLRLGEELIKEFAWRAGFKIDQAEVHGAYGDALLRLGQAEEAAKNYQQALSYLQPVVDANPDDLSQQPLLALSHERLATVSARLGKRPEADKHAQEALKLRTELLQAAPANLPRQADYVLALARAGKYADAAAAAAKVRPKVSQSADLLLQVARCYATCAAAGTPQKADYVKQALETLRAATDKDYQDAVALQTDPDLEAVRGEAEFRALVEKVKAR